MKMVKTRRQRERERHRREILSAARSLFAARGYDGTAMNDIARHAEFAVGTLYKYFKNKEELFDDLVLDAFQTVGPRVKDVLLGVGNEVERVEKLIDRTTVLFFEHREMSMLYFLRTSGRSLAVQLGLKGEARRIDEENTRLLEELFRSGIARGYFADLPPALLTAALHGVTHGVFTEILSSGDTYKPEDVSAYRKRIFLDAIRTKPRIRLDSARS